MTDPTKHTNPESGNVLIYIIGAIFLIGLLTVIVRGSSMPGAGIDEETLILKTSQVRAYASELERGVQFVLRNGHSETEISFAHPNHSSAYGTYGTTPTAEVFNPSGGGAEWRDNDTEIQTQDEDWAFVGSNWVHNVGTQANDATAVELLALLPYVTQDFCISLNEAVGVDNPFDVPPQDDGQADITTLFAGTFTFVRRIQDIHVPKRLETKTEGCFEGDTDPPADTYHYYKVLLAR